ncbi:MAG: FAD-dependent oxidoreductase [Actinobacteria bacterium]|nr:FAD-dependent oxidoreductase [Actinomycetota bacterium]
MAKESHDIIIIGAGPAGLAAALYTSRDRYSTLLLDKFAPGGQINLTDRIENYPGFERISGADLVANMTRQTQAFGVELKTSAEVVGLSRRDDSLLEVSLTDKTTHLSRAVILAPGSDYRKLGVPGEEGFTGSGVSYCGTCDAPFFKGKHVLAVGGGNVAVEDTIHLSKFAAKVTIIHRRDEFRATPVLVEELLSTAKNSGNIEILYSHTLSEIKGSGKVQSVTLLNKKTGESFDLSVDGVFMFVGMVPNTKFLDGIVELNDNGYIRTPAGRLRSSMQGVFVAGDCRESAAMQLATACGDGVEAALLIRQYFREPDFWTKHDQTQPNSWA